MLVWHVILTLPLSLIGLAVGAYYLIYRKVSS